MAQKLLQYNDYGTPRFYVAKNETMALYQLMVDRYRRGVYTGDILKEAELVFGIREAVTRNTRAAVFMNGRAELPNEGFKWVVAEDPAVTPQLNMDPKLYVVDVVLRMTVLATTPELAVKTARENAPTEFAAWDEDKFAGVKLSSPVRKVEDVPKVLLDAVPYSDVAASTNKTARKLIEEGLSRIQFVSPETDLQFVRPVGSPGAYIKSR